jgi:two-component system sensor histidine kinase MtrB
MTAPSTAADKQGRSEPGAGGAARGSRLPARQGGNRRGKPNSKKKKKRRGWYKIVRQSRLVRMVGRRLPRQAKPPLKAARKWQRERVDQLRRRWRRSLQLRVVTTTLALSTLVIAVLGFFLTQQISDGLLLNKEKSATAQVSQGLTVAESNANLTRAPTSTAIANNFLYPTAQELQNASGNNSSYIVVIEIKAKLVGSSAYTRGVAGGADPSSIPAALSASVQSEQDHFGSGKVYYAPTIIVSTLGRGDQPGLAVGTPLGNYYQLYYLFPMVQEQQTLSLVQRTLVGAGLALIVLLALIASLVTRWVVIPVRHAAQAAQRLSAGRLGERMRVRGADDLAALATSFNDMAASLQD